MRQFLKITSIFALALIFAAGTAVAQDAEIDQDGNNMDADIEQTGDVGNLARIDQGTNLPNKVKSGFKSAVFQDGGDNTAFVEQDGDGDLKAFVDQIGDDNTAQQDQRLGGGQNNLAKVDIDQNGDENVARQFQTVYSGGGADPKAVAITDQDGSYNSARTVQDGSGTSFSANITQEMNNNLARIFQQDYGSTASGYHADIDQTGMQNDARIQQSP